MRRALNTALAFVCVLLIGAAAANPVLAAPDPATVDCVAHLRLTRPYSATELRHALATLSADVKEYTSCPDVLQRALDARLSGLHVNGARGSSGGSFLPAPVLALLIVLLLAVAVFLALHLRRRRPD